MSKRRFIICALAACLVSSAAVAQEQTITVTPSNPGDIVIATVNGAYSEQTIAPPGPGILGAGALWCSTGGNGSDTANGVPGQIWAGTNAYNGTALSAITELRYNYWNTNAGIHSPAKTNYPERWSPPRQPIGVRMVVDPNDGVSQPKMFIYRPLVYGAKGRIGEGMAPYVDTSDRHNSWITVDCLADVGTSGPGAWQEIQWIDSATVPTLWTGSWTDLKARFPNGRICLNTPQQPGNGEWPEAVPPNTPNACSLSLEWGGEMNASNAYALSVGKPYPIWNNWYREACMGIAWVDNWRIGIEGQDVKVYDFECDADGYKTPVTGSGASLASKATTNAYRKFPFIIYGKVTSVSGDEFMVSDGSPVVYEQNSATPPGLPRDVWCKVSGGVPVSVGDYVRVKAVNVPGFSNRYNADGPILNRFQTDIYSIEPLLGL